MSTDFSQMTQAQGDDAQVQPSQAQSVTDNASAAADQATPAPQQPAPQPPQAGSPDQPAAPVAPTGNKWANMVKGALSGLLLGGIPGGVAGAIDPNDARQSLANRRAISNIGVQQAQSNLRFQNLQAAQIQSDVAYKKMLMENMPKTLQLEQDKAEGPLVKELLDRGISPAIVTAEDQNHPKAYQQALETYAGSHGGAVPPMLTFHVGGQTIAFDMNDMKTTSGTLDAVNRYNRIMGSRVLSPAEFNNPKILAPGAKTAMIKSAYDLMTPVAESSDKLPDQIGKYDQIIARLNTAKQVGGADTEQINQDISDMQAVRDRLQKSMDSGMANKIQVGKQIAVARAKGMADARYVEVTVDGVGTTFMPAGLASQQGVSSAKVVTQLAPYVKPAEDAEKAYQMFQEAYRDHEKGVETGAPSMVALSSHLMTTFGSVKGARITKDMIQEHLGARSVSDSGVVAINRLMNGDALSPAQWNDFRALITQSRNLSWGTAAKEGAARGVNLRALVPSDLGGGGDITKIMFPSQPATSNSHSAPAKTNRPSLATFERH